MAEIVAGLVLAVLLALAVMAYRAIGAEIDRRQARRDAWHNAVHRMAEEHRMRDRWN
jgi:hypothetical protein